MTHKFATCPSCGTERQVHHGRVSTYCRRCKPLHAPAKAQEPAEPMPTPSQVPLKRGHSLNHVGGRDRVISTERVVYAVTREEEGEHYEDGGRYMSLATFYDEYALAPEDRRLPAVAGRTDDRIDATEPFRRWTAQHG